MRKKMRVAILANEDGENNSGSSKADLVDDPDFKNQIDPEALDSDVST